MERDVGSVRKLVSKLVSRLRRWKPNEESHKTMIELDFAAAAFLIILIGVVPIALGAEFFRLGGLLGFAFGELGVVLLVFAVVYYVYGDERPKRE